MTDRSYTASADIRRDALAPGTVLNGYVIEAVAGSGGFGIVYRARHHALGITVAIKEYLPAELALREGTTVRARSTGHREAFEDGLRRFRDEAKRLIEFSDHPAIVACRDFFYANNTAYFVMEYVDGQALSQLLRVRESAGYPFTKEDLLAVVLPILEGVGKLHDAGVLHRDIKPSNILIRHSDELPVLIDFGTAKQGLAEQSKSLAPYTPGYAAPEQVAEGDLGPWTDMYGLGATMWRMVAGAQRDPSGERPGLVRAETRQYAVVRGRPDPQVPASVVGSGQFPDYILEAIDRCMNLQEADRVQGGADLANALLGQGRRPQRIIEQALPPVVAEPEPRKTKSFLPSPMALTAICIGLACVGVAGFALSSILGLAFENGSDTELAGSPSAGAPLRIEPVPASAAVVLVDHDEHYSPGMLVKPGTYSVRVSAVAHHTITREFAHAAPGTELRVELEPLVRAASRKSSAPRPDGEARTRAGRGGNPPSGPRLAATFRVDRVPANASVAFVSNRMPYRDGMRLSPGEYRMRVSAPGFKPVTRDIDHRDVPTVARVTLEPVEIVTSPRVLHKIEPKYSDEARSAKLEGLVKLSIEVWEDGVPHNIRVTQGLGMGLDEKAIEAVKEWRFVPGKKNGLPVRVKAQVHVNFRLLENLIPSE